MRSLLPLTVYCISLVSLQQLRALPAAERPDTARLDLINKLFDQSEEEASVSGRRTDIATPSSASSRFPKWLSNFPRSPPAAGVRTVPPSLSWARPSEQIEQRAPRARRHAHPSRGGHHYPHHAQLMRVGCVLGTCQVQNLSHRLYQLIGQSGREDSSPINPKSPHSYG